VRIAITIPLICSVIVTAALIGAYRLNVSMASAVIRRNDT